LTFTYIKDTNMKAPQALIRVGQTIVDLRSVEYAALTTTEDDNGLKGPELKLLVAGQSVLLFDDQALHLWALLGTLATPVEAARLEN
jgi:hypothetical protein